MQSSSRMVSVSLSVLDWQAVTLALTRAANANLTDTYPAAEIGRARLRYIRETISEAVGEEATDATR